MSMISDDQRIVPLALLKDLEWSSYTWDEPCCPVCGAFASLDLPQTVTHPYVKAGMHHADCALQQAIEG